MKSILQIFASRRMALMLPLGFSAGIPLALTAGTLQAWISSESIDIKTIGLFNLVGLPYTYKFLWAPFLDRYFPGVLGRRRGWMLWAQLLLIASIIAMAFSDPKQNIGLMAVLAVCVAFFSATQDIVIDAFRTESLKTEEYGAASGVYIMGYRLAMLTSGALALILADHMSWKAVYLLMAACLSVGLIATIFSNEPVSERPPRTLKEAVVEPFLDYFKRTASIEILFFVFLYKLDSAIASSLMTKFFLDLGFSKTDIGLVIKTFGLAATIVGALAGGVLIPKMGLGRALLIFGILQGATNLLFYWMTMAGSNRIALIVTIAGENLAGGMGTAAYAAFLMGLCNKRFTAFQYALLTSVMALPARLVGGFTGYLQDGVGWQNYFIIATLVSIPGLLMLKRFKNWKYEST